MGKDLTKQFPGVRIIPFEQSGLVAAPNADTEEEAVKTIKKVYRKTNDRGITSRPFRYSGKVADALDWLKIACSHDKNEQREALKYLHNEGNRAFGSNGYRIHAVQSKNFAPKDTLIPDELRKRKKDPIKSPNLTPIIPTSHNTIVSVSRYDLSRALAACAPFAKESSNIVRLDVRATHLTVCATSAETGDCSIVIEQGAGFGGGNLYAEDNAHYKMTGDPIEMAFNYKFLRDALSGMSEIFSMGFTTANSPALIWGDVNGIKREAIIMPMYIGR